MMGRELVLEIDELIKTEIGKDGKTDLSTIDETKIFKDCSRRFYSGRERPSYDSLQKIRNIKICSHRHGYDGENHACPFCGDDKVVSTIEGMMWDNTIFYNDYLYENEGSQISVNKTIVDGVEIEGDLRMRVYYSGSYKYGYCVAQFEQIHPSIRRRQILTANTAILY